MVVKRWTDERLDRLATRTERKNYQSLSPSRRLPLSLNDPIK